MNWERMALHYYTIFMNLHDAQDRTNYIISFENREQL